MKDPDYHHTPDLNKRAFARTNPQTIRQRVDLLRELMPEVGSIAEICCGDCSQQAQAYRQAFALTTYLGVDVEPVIAARNLANGIDCLCGDALDPGLLSNCLGCDVIFFGPPLSVECDGHRIFPFRKVRPSYLDFAKVLLGSLGYNGTLVCICPRNTHLGEIQQLYQKIKSLRPDFGLRLVFSSYSTLTGFGETTAPRLKYVDLWFSNRLEDAWELRTGAPPSRMP